MLRQEYSHESGRHSPPERMPLSDRSFTGTVSISRFLPESESVLGVAATGVGGRGDLFVFPGLSGGAVRRWKGPWPALRPARLGCATRFPVENGAACRWLARSCFSKSCTCSLSRSISCHKRWFSSCIQLLPDHRLACPAVSRSAKSYQAQNIWLGARPVDSCAKLSVAARNAARTRIKATGMAAQPFRSRQDRL